MQWYYAINGQRQGPVGQAEFEQFVAQGIVKPDTLVWREGMADWKPYVQVAGAAVPAAGGVDDGTEVCAVSGQRFPRREMIQYEGKWISAARRDEFFQRLREGVAGPEDSVVPGRYGYGGFWRRFVARFLDGLILGACQMVIVLPAMFLLLPGLANGRQPGVGSMILFQVVVQGAAIVIGLGYDLFFIRKYDATPGKMALGLKVLRKDGSKLSVGRVVGRHFANIVSSLTLLIGYIIAGFDDEKRALHDHMCDTRVIKTR